MSAPAAFSGDYTDLRFVKTRSVCQVVIEIDISQASAFVAAFGAPMPGTGVPVALAKLNLESSSTVEPRTVNADVAGSNPASPASPVRRQLEASVALLDKPAKERRPWSALSYAEQAGIRCQEPGFWHFLNEVADEGTHIISATDAADFVRAHCNVDSRAEIRPSNDAGRRWMGLDVKYESWLRRPTFR